MEFSTIYDKQLPKRKKFTAQILFSIIAGISSILAFITQIIASETSAKIYPISLLTMSIVLIIFCLYKEKKSHESFAEAILYLHYISHLVRDFLILAEKGKRPPLKEFLEKMLDAIAKCYSLVVHTNCRATIKELEKNLTLKTVYRDSFSQQYVKRHCRSEIEHKLDKNTDFKNLWYGIEDCTRYFLSNNLPEDWKNHKYESSSFEFYHNKPEIKKILFFSKIKWPLPYKSTLVVPIRYIKEFEPPQQDNIEKPNDDIWKFWGFLCIDCNQKNMFDNYYCPEIGAAFADILFTFFNVLEGIKES